MLKNRLVILVFAFVLGAGTHAWIVHWHQEDHRAGAESAIRRFVKIGDDGDHAKEMLEKNKIELRYDESLHRYSGIFPLSSDSPHFDIDLDENHRVKNIAVYYVHVR